MVIPVIDLFAGPGGLGEGFTALQRCGDRAFQIKLSIEKDEHAHRTLELRAFFRQFPYGEAPDAYYDYLRGTISRNALFAKFPAWAEAARLEAWWAELGNTKFPDRQVDERIRQALGNRKTWLLIGGPPCQAYSLVGRSRRKNDPEFAKDEKHFLYKEYLRILAVHRPPVFVMENVKGLLSATVRNKGIFDKILDDLKAPAEGVNYRVVSLVRSPINVLGEFDPEDYVVRAECYGIPQARHRVILLGIRSDICREPEQLRRQPEPTIQQAISDLPPLRSGLSKESDSSEEWRAILMSAASEPWFKDAKVDDSTRRGLTNVVTRLSAALTRGAEFVPGKPAPRLAKRWFSDHRLAGFCNHATRSHIRSDLHRYLFAAVFAQQHGRSPSLEEFPAGLLPLHENVKQALEGAMFNDRFRVQLKGRPSTTVVSHIAKDGHYYIHYDPRQCRSLTVREAARLQTFPDNYFFEGPRTEQYHQVGNAVPPLLARQIAKIVADLLM